ncbi:MAG: flavodoxin family protein [Spirochaetota bacterium]
MRVATVFFPYRNRDRLATLARALARGIEAQGHDVDVIDGTRDVNTKLTMYGYIAVGTEATNLFGGKIPQRVEEFLSSAGIVGGKKSYAFVRKRAIGGNKTLKRLMTVMEHEGMFLKISNALHSPDEAEEIGKRLSIG